MCPPARHRERTSRRHIRSRRRSSSGVPTHADSGRRRRHDECQLNTRQSHPASVLVGVSRPTYVLGFGEDPIVRIESAGSAEEGVVRASQMVSISIRLRRVLWRPKMLVPLQIGILVGLWLRHRAVRAGGPRDEERAVAARGSVSRWGAATSAATQRCRSRPRRSRIPTGSEIEKCRATTPFGRPVLHHPRRRVNQRVLDVRRCRPSPTREPCRPR